MVIKKSIVEISVLSKRLRFYRIIAVFLPLFFSSVHAEEHSHSYKSESLQELAETQFDIRAPRDSDYQPVDDNVSELGRLLFFEKALSGNRNISCAGCHSPLVGTSDGLSINLGEGAHGLSVTRDPGAFPPQPDAPIDRGSRNAPGLFNLGATEFTSLMHDGRFQLSQDFPGGLQSPAGQLLPIGFATSLEVLSVFPFTDVQEMLGQPDENEIAAAGVNSEFLGVWDAVLNRIKSIPEYHDLFLNAFEELQGDMKNLRIFHVGRAIAQYQADVFRSDNSRFDRYMRGDKNALTKQEKRGLRVFLTSGDCASCHNGPFLTDHKFYAIGMPQIGPGFGGVGIDGREDFGREGVSNDPDDRYRFRTPSLRNVALTGPWGHDGAYNSLELVVKHHLDALKAVNNYNPEQRVLPSRIDLDERDLIAYNNPETTAAISQKIEIQRVDLSVKELSDLMYFLHALTDTNMLDLRIEVPARLPSGLTLAD